MDLISRERTEWLARHAFPNEPALRAQIARWNMPPGLDADDVVQEVYAKLAMLDDTTEIEHPRAYMRTMARNIIGMHMRRGRIVPITAIEDFEGLEEADQTPDPERQVSDRQQLSMLATAVSELPKRSRVPFLLRIMDDLPYRDIGERLGMSENAVQKSIARSLKTLADRLGRGGGNGIAQASIRETGEKTDRKHGDPSD
ncbi:sigma-70 family RNA polymerase sigma factor [Altererythrobacter sp. ZODW24]|uniref:RNA polymerase sigma factor n=1 Tax=Altererythrobacter sp. ZODW24 TaxID=2185142 RepID=UPI000DF73378|nr:sigma-70 family RNA polymerase sigma factor [Altererythrobacter sp. ZODW24]